MAKRENGVNVKRVEGAPSDRMASPITTGFSPAQGGTLDKIRSLAEPEDTLGITPKRGK